MNLSIPRTNWGNEFPDKAQFWSNKYLTKEKYQVLVPSGSLAMCVMGSKVHQLRCLRMQAEQCRMDNPSLAQKGNEPSGITHIDLQPHQLCSLHFQPCPGCCSTAGLLLHLCNHSGFSWLWAVFHQQLCRAVLALSRSGQPSSVPCHSGHCRTAAAFAPLQGLEPAKAFFRSALTALDLESLKNLYKQMWFLLFT